MAKKAKKPGSELKGAARLPLLKAVKGKANPAGPFADLTWTQQRAAEQWLWKFCKRWEGNLPPWRRGILIGVARRLAKNPPVPRFGYKLHAQLNAPLGGQSLARKCKALGVHNRGIIVMRSRRLKAA